ncbi:MAG: hypothetical protein IRZ16_20900 [Myxococcaceae bacterium]|nr:hypothetical protein [Myxococcaceae bacterium]
MKRGVLLVDESLTVRTQGRLVHGPARDFLDAADGRAALRCCWSSPA